MARAIWKGAISFGMVTIPVSLTSAAQAKDVSFHLLDKRDETRVRNLRWNAEKEREVPADEIVKGYEFAKGQYVIVEDEDFEKLPVASTHTIEISAFVDAAEIPPAYYDRAYYLEPEELGVKGYALMLDALEEKELVAIGKIAFRQREHLCALRPSEGAIVLETLYYADEIREQPKIPKVKLGKQELDMAFSLVDLLKTDFEPEQYKDEYREALLDLIEAKREGRKIVEEKAEPERKVIDLMEALKASVQAAQKSQPKAHPHARPKKKAS
jgi:DNA end-binding protein Ku